MTDYEKFLWSIWFLGLITGLIIPGAIRGIKVLLDLLTPKFFQSKEGAKCT